MGLKRRGVTLWNSPPQAGRSARVEKINATTLRNKKVLLMGDNREFRSPATQDGLGLSDIPFFSLLSHRPQPLQPLLAPLRWPSLRTPLQDCSAAGLTLSLSSPSLIAEALLRFSCLFWRGALLCRTRANTLHLWAPLAMQHGGVVEFDACTQPELSAAPLQFCMCAGISVVQKAGGKAFASSPGASVPAGGGGILTSCEHSLAARGWHVVYTGVCELSQTSQTRIRTEPGDNQCSNIATQGFLRETSKTARQSRCHSPCGFHFPLPWLLSGEAGAGHRARFRPQAAKQPVTGSLVAMWDRSLTVPCMVARPSAMQVPHLWQSRCSQPPISSPSPLLAPVLLPK